MKTYTGIWRMVMGAWLMSVSLGWGADWPQMRGPGRGGVSPETGLAREWPAGGPRVVWTAEVGEGFAGAAVRDGEVYLLDRVDDQQDVLRCLDLNTGKELWRCAYEAPGTLPYNGSRNVPTVDERYVFTVGPWGHLHCVDRKTHEAVWSAHLVNDFKDAAVDRDEPAKDRAEKLARAQVPEWGVTQSPLLYQDLVIVGPQTQKVGLVAYEKATGKVRWKSGYIGRNWYSHVSPTLVKLGGVEQVIMLAQPSDPEKYPPAIVSSLDPRTGAILWSVKTPRPHKVPVPSPVAVGEDRLFLTGGINLGSLILQVTKEGNTKEGNTKEGERWATQWVSVGNAGASLLHDPVLYKGQLYMTSLKDQGGKGVGLVCLDLKGELCWQSGAKAQYDLGSVLIADDLIFVLHGKNGELHLVEANAKEYRVLSKAKVLRAEGAMVWAPMALSEGKLIVRDQRQMKCLDVRQGNKH